ncbi:iron ABC transporter permease [Reichenbachiella versicolor]|uniref:iron ABC transporter permease n=1 Tax=Reichenbachiella versicolor TaxID=1821036 RepID=UPI000D6E8193|nr:iron ABC transporter permease [Reichenbachiella versicolor]
MKNSWLIVSVGITLVIGLFLLDLSLGSVKISVSELINILQGTPSKKSWEYIILNFRLPKAFTAVLTGAGISVAGLQMQTLFRNPLAGPSVLGISHGASLGVAVFVLSSTAMFGTVLNLQEKMGSWGLVMFAIGGSFLVLSCVLIASSRVSDSVTILIIGIMFGFITGAVVNILQFFSDPELIQNFLVWTFGSLSGVAWSQLQVMGPIVLIALLASLLFSKQMNALLLGENYATGVGINVARTRLKLIMVTSIMAGTITAFTGPIAFIGVAVPHLARLLFRTSNHKILIPGTMMCGIIIMLACDIVSQLPGSQTTLPVNSITALFGAPVILTILLKNKKMKGAF